MHDQPSDPSSSPEANRMGLEPNLKVLLVDDFLLLRCALRQLLEQEPEVRVVGEAATGADALILVRKCAPNLVVMDIELPDAEGGELTRQLLRETRAMRIIHYSAISDRPTVNAALLAGARGFILRPQIFEQLAPAIKVVMAGGLYLSPELGVGIFEDYRRTLREGRSRCKLVLTERDRSLLKLISEGLRGRDIAARLGLSLGAALSRCARLRRKLGCPRTAKMIRYAIREGIVAI